MKVTLTLDGVIVVKDRKPGGKKTQEIVFDTVICTLQIADSDLPDPEQIITKAKDVFGPVMNGTVQGIPADMLGATAGRTLADIVNLTFNEKDEV